MKKATVENDVVVVTLRDKREIRFPLSWSKPLTKADPQQRLAIRVTPWFLFWDDLDEMIGVENILYGEKLYLK